MACGCGGVTQQQTSSPEQVAAEAQARADQEREARKVQADSQKNAIANSHAA